jgi:flagella basal body P-ring formation protein FlgA
MTARPRYARQPGREQGRRRWRAGFALVVLAQGISPSAAEPRQDPAQVAAAVQRQAAALAPPGARVTLGSVAGAAAMPACTAPLEVRLSGGPPYAEAQVRCAAPAWQLYVSVTLAETERVAVAARPIAPGQILGPGDIAMAREPVAGFAGRQVYYDPAQLLGAQAVMGLPAGSMIAAADVMAPVVVKSGETVTAQVLSGGVRISVGAVANETGRIGDTILLTNTASGRRFSALITAEGPVIRLGSQ